MVSFYEFPHSEGFLGPLSDGNILPDIPQITIKTKHKMDNIKLKTYFSLNQMTPIIIRY